MHFLTFIMLLASVLSFAQNKPRIFIFTDINIDSGDPDDRQSLVHLLWYANEMEIEGINPDRINAKGYEACELALKAYARDYEAIDLTKLGYPRPEDLKPKIANNWERGMSLFQEAASDTSSPLYVLIWGNMVKFREALLSNPEHADNLRIITIGTGLMMESNIPHIPKNWKKEEPCEQMNWNALGRNDIYNDARFSDMWWLELNWTYEGMFTGPEPAQMLDKLAVFGHLGRHMKDVVKNYKWAQYFRVGDTPTVLYMIYAKHDLNDPESSSWAGKFCKPFPKERPNYYTDFSGDLDWDYANPCSTWEQHVQFKDLAASTLEEKRNEMYDALLMKLRTMYAIDN